MTSKPVNIGVQCLATLFVPTGIYAFKRIKKLRLGLIIYAVCYVMYIVATVYPLKNMANSSSNINMDTIGLISFVSVGLIIMSFLLPIIFIRKWSKEYNQSLTNQLQH